MNRLLQQQGRESNLQWRTVPVQSRRYGEPAEIRMREPPMGRRCGQAVPIKRTTHPSSCRQQNRYAMLCDGCEQKDEAEHRNDRKQAQFKIWTTVQKVIEGPVLFRPRHHQQNEGCERYQNVADGRVQLHAPAFSRSGSAIAVAQTPSQSPAILTLAGQWVFREGQSIASASDSTISSFAPERLKAQQHCP